MFKKLWQVLEWTFQAADLSILGSSFKLGGAGESSIVRGQRLGPVFVERRLRPLELEAEPAAEQVQLPAAVDGPKQNDRFFQSEVNFIRTFGLFLFEFSDRSKRCNCLDATSSARLAADDNESSEFCRNDESARNESWQRTMNFFCQCPIELK